MKEKGNIGEDLVVKKLIQEGYQILEKNWIKFKGEIDIIAVKENTIHFIEVKLRKADTWRNPVEGMTKRQMKFIIRTAEYYIQQNNIKHEAQFDFYAIEQNGSTYEIEAYLEAFHPMTI